MHLAFGVMDLKGDYNKAAYLEWIVSLVYIFYVASYALDLVPAIKTKHHRFPGVDEIENGQNVSGGPAYTNGESASYSSTQPMTETTDGRYYQPPTGPVAPSRNF